MNDVIGLHSRKTRIERHFTAQALLPLKTIVTDVFSNQLTMEFAFQAAIDRFCAHGKIIFIGNGGSAAIASHMAEDYTKNGGIRAMAFNDAALLTCFANDYGYERMFAQALDVYADKGDILVAISSSGKSQNILNGAKRAREMGLTVYTLSGFGSGNPLRNMGDLNFYVPASDYGSVEITHLSLLHAVLDFICEERK